MHVFHQPPLQNSSGSSDSLCMLIRRAFGYQNAGEAHSRPQTNCSLSRNLRTAPTGTVSTGTLLQEQSLQERSFYRKAGVLT